MLNESTVKPHKVKWIEAERELAVRWIFIPDHSVVYGYFPIHNEHLQTLRPGKYFPPGDIEQKDHQRGHQRPENNGRF